MDTTPATTTATTDIVLTPAQEKEYESFSKYVLPALLEAIRGAANYKPETE